MSPSVIRPIFPWIVTYSYGIIPGSVGFIFYSIYIIICIYMLGWQIRGQGMGHPHSHPTTHTMGSVFFHLFLLWHCLFLFRWSYIKIRHFRLLKDMYSQAKILFSFAIIHSIAHMVGGLGNAHILWSLCPLALLCFVWTFTYAFFFAFQVWTVFISNWANKGVLSCHLHQEVKLSRLTKM